MLLTVQNGLVSSHLCSFMLQITNWHVRFHGLQLWFPQITKLRVNLPDSENCLDTGLDQLLTPHIGFVRLDVHSS